MERKYFFKVLTAGIVSGTLITYLESCKKNNDVTPAPSVDFTLDLSSSSNAALLSAGGSVVSNSVLVINNNGNYIALSDICTHQGCSVGYNRSSQKVNCPCHGAVYGLTGAVEAGPAPSSLKKYSVSQNGNSLHIFG